MRHESWNRITLIGRVGKEPRIFPARNNDSIVFRCSLATHRDAPPTAGPGAFLIDWHQIVAFGALAKYAAANIHKGSRIAVEGLLVYRIAAVNKPDGSLDFTRKFPEIEASHIACLDPRAPRSAPPDLPRSIARSLPLELDRLAAQDDLERQPPPAPPPLNPDKPRNVSRRPQSPQGPTRDS